MGPADHRSAGDRHFGHSGKKIDGVLHFCLQAKEEPGNLHSVQLSPTVQATYSNYTRVHGGSLPHVLEYFLDPSRDRVLYCKLQTEDGGRFLFKSNRNMIVLASEQEANLLPPGFIWLTLRQIAALMLRDNLINACARSVFSALFGSACSRDHLHELRQLEAAWNPETTGDVPLRVLSAHDPETQPGAGTCCVEISAILQWLDDMRAQNHIFQKRIGLASLGDWEMDGNGYFSQKQGKYFKIVGLRVASLSREVKAWSQPILDNVGTGIIGLLITRRRGRTYMLMQAKAEAGNRNIVQIGPTVQFTQENYINNDRLAKPFLFDEFMEPRVFPVVQESRQSEEGARFFREEHQHRVLLPPVPARADAGGQCNACRLRQQGRRKGPAVCSRRSVRSARL